MTTKHNKKPKQKEKQKQNKYEKKRERRTYKGVYSILYMDMNREERYHMEDLAMYKADKRF